MSFPEEGAGGGTAYLREAACTHRPCTAVGSSLLQQKQQSSTGVITVMGPHKWQTQRARWSQTAGVRGRVTDLSGPRLPESARLHLTHT